MGFPRQILATKERPGIWSGGMAVAVKNGVTPKWQARPMEPKTKTGEVWRLKFHPYPFECYITPDLSTPGGLFLG